MHYEELTLDVGKYLPIQHHIQLRIGEGGLTTIEAQIRNDTEPYDLTGCSVMFLAENAGEKIVYDAATIESPKEGRISWVVSKNLTVIAGQIKKAYFRISKGTDDITTQDIPIVVKPNVDLSAEEAEEYESEFEKLLNDINDLQARANTVLSDATQATTNANNAADACNSAADRIEGAEDARISAENARANAETARQSAETARDKAEQARADAESAREAAETARADEWGTIKQEAQSATQNATWAAEAAQSATSELIDAASSANTAADRANKASGQLEDTIRLATDASGDATIAASVANAATERANTALSDMAEAMSKFNTIIGTDIAYAQGESSTIPPEDGWTAAQQSVDQGLYQWTRTTTYYLNGESRVTYCVAYQGVDGRDGIGTESSSLFWLHVDENGDLYATFSDDANPPQFRYDQSTGNVYAIV